MHLILVTSQHLSKNYLTFEEFQSPPTIDVGGCIIIYSLVFTTRISRWLFRFWFISVGRQRPTGKARRYILSSWNLLTSKEEWDGKGWGYSWRQRDWCLFFDHNIMSCWGCWSWRWSHATIWAGTTRSTGSVRRGIARQMRVTSAVKTSRKRQDVLEQCHDPHQYPFCHHLADQVRVWLREPVQEGLADALPPVLNQEDHLGWDAWWGKFLSLPSFFMVHSRQFCQCRLAQT